jgi:hypothetical protein
VIKINSRIPDLAEPLPPEVLLPLMWNLQEPHVWLVFLRWWFQWSLSSNNSFTFPSSFTFTINVHREEYAFISSAVVSIHSSSQFLSYNCVFSSTCSTYLFVSSIIKSPNHHYLQISQDYHQSMRNWETTIQKHLQKLLRTSTYTKLCYLACMGNNGVCHSHEKNS